MGIIRRGAAYSGIGRIVLGMVLVLGVSACTSDSAQRASQSGDEVARAEDLINDGQYSEAIYILNQKMLSPTPQVRLLLASAYTARANIQLYSYRDLAAEIISWNNRKDTPPLVSEDSPLNTATKILSTIQFVVHSFSAVPIPLSEPAFQDLTSALKVLDEGGAMPGGPTIFRALIRASLLKYKLLQRSKTESYKIGQGKDCATYLLDFSEMAQDIEGDLYKLLEDIAHVLSNLEQRQRILELAKSLRSAVTNLSGILQKATDAAKVAEPIQDSLEPNAPMLSELCK